MTAHSLRIGAHVDQTDPLAEARAREADLVQFFIGDPQGWKTPIVPDLAHDDSVDFYIHAPYVINVATTNNRIRIPSRKLLAQQAEAAAAIGAKAVIVHGGHVLKGEDPEVGVENWRKTFERTQFPLQILIENTAGGDNAMARRFDRLARLWDAVGEYGVGFCLDTCHAFAGGEDLTDVVERAKAITGRIDLVHANDSKGGFDSGQDRHENFGSGQIGLERIAAVIAAAGAPVVCETPGGPEGQAGDIAALRKTLAN
jgi:deoxyribonuclease-4